MEYVIEAGEYAFSFYIYKGEFADFYSALYLGNYGVEVTKNNVRIDRDKTNLHEDLGITKEEFLDLIIEGTKELIAEELHREANKDPSTSIRSFVFFAIDDRDSEEATFYGFTEHDIFKKISSRYHVLYSQGYEGSKVYVHTREVFPVYDYIIHGELGYKTIGFDFHANTSLIETICDKIEANQGINEEGIDEIADEVLEELL